MKLNDIRFWKFEGFLLLGGWITSVFLYVTSLLLGIICGKPYWEYYDFIILLCSSNIIGGFFTWRVAQKFHWVKLPIWQTMIAAIVLFLIQLILTCGKIDQATISIIFLFTLISSFSAVIPNLLCCYLNKMILNSNNR